MSVVTGANFYLGWLNTTYQHTPDVKLGFPAGIQMLQWEFKSDKPDIQSPVYFQLFIDDAAPGSNYAGAFAGALHINHTDGIVSVKKGTDVTDISGAWNAQTT